MPNATQLPADAAANSINTPTRPTATDAPQRLGGLLSYRGHVESISEWPFDTALLLRFALYLLIPLGSWLGGALMERGLDSLLD